MKLFQNEMIRYEKMHALSKTALIAINDNLNSILENLPELVYWKDKNYLYQGCNKHAAELLNLNTPADIINKSDYDFGWTAERIKELHDVDKLVIEKGISQVDEDAIPVNGVMKIFLTSKTPLRNKQGEIIGILGISTDISERKQMEKELIKAKEQLESKQASEAVSNLVFNEATGLRMPTESKETLVSFYLKLNEGMREEFKTILSKIPATKVFDEVGDAGNEMSNESAYKKMGEIADGIMASEGINSVEAMKKARKENLELAELARGYKK